MAIKKQSKLGTTEMCWFKHKWIVIRLEKYIDTSFGLRVNSTLITYQCTKCMDIKTKITLGHLSMDDILKH